MSTLSERLEELASREYVVEVGPHGTVVDDAFDADTQNLIRQAAALCKRYEDAPVGTLEDVVDRISYVKWGFSSGDSFPGAPKLRTMDGQRVRLVVEE